MASIAVEGPMIVVKLSWLGRLAAFHRDVRVPLPSVRAVRVEQHPWRALRGIRAPGTGFPGIIAYGTRRYWGGRDFAALLGTKPAVRIDLDPGLAGFGRLVVTVAYPSATVNAVCLAAGIAPTG